MNLLDDRELFKDLVEAVSVERGLIEAIVEKDFMVSILLQRLSIVDDLQIVFKGGTSLSKCYTVINRFSEDIDITIRMSDLEVSSKVKKMLKKEIVQSVKDVGFTITNISEIKSRMDFNQYIVEYPMFFGTEGSFNSKIIVETIVSYEPYPCDNRLVSNYLIDFLEENGNNDFIEKYQLDRFEMMVQSIERTFIDKIYAICDCYLSNKLDRNSRHIYDIHKIWTSDFLDVPGLKSLAKHVAKDRQRVGRNNLSCEPGSKPKLILQKIINTEAFRNDYEKITANLIFDEVSYQDCIGSIENLIYLNFIPEVIDKY